MAAMILVWPGAVAIGLSLGLLGSGGSILTVPVLVYLVGQDEKLAIAGSLAIVGIIAAIGALPYSRARLIDWRSVWLFGLPGMLGTYAGAWSSQFIAGSVQLALFAGVMLAAAWFMLKPMTLKPGARAPRASLRIVSDGLAVGMLTGLVGVGGGFLVVPALVLLGGLSMHRAIGTSLVIVALKSISGFAKYVDVLNELEITLELDVIVIVSALGILGSLAGNAMASHIPQQKLKSLFGYFLIGMGLLILSQSLPAVIQN